MNDPIDQQNSDNARTEAEAIEYEHRAAAFYAQATALWRTIHAKTSAPRPAHIMKNAKGWRPARLPWGDKRNAYALLTTWAEIECVPETLLAIFRAICGVPPLPGQERSWGLYERCVTVEAKAPADPDNWPISRLTVDDVLLAAKGDTSQRRSLERWRNKSSSAGADYRARIAFERGIARFHAKLAARSEPKRPRRQNGPDPRLVEMIHRAVTASAPSQRQSSARPKRKPAKKSP